MEGLNKIRVGRARPSSPEVIAVHSLLGSTWGTAGLNILS